MSLDKETVMRTAKLARIALNTQECADVRSELDHILGWVDQLKDVDVSDIPPMVVAGEASLRTRMDEVTQDICCSDILSNAPQRSGDFFTVPKVVE